jgi:protein-S-isoprenylcysteine O-methyltransferase Ste14
MILSSLVLYIITLINYASTPPDQPVTKGIYRISRHPQQVLTEILLVGCGIATDSYLIILLCIIQTILLYRSMKVQERNCIERYGKPYEDYLEKTPRFFIIF